MPTDLLNHDVTDAGRATLRVTQPEPGVAVVTFELPATLNAVTLQFVRELPSTLDEIADDDAVVDLWGGVADEGTGRPWERDTVNVIMSSSKGLTALCGHILIDRGQLDLDAPVAHYWPEFAKNGKDEIPVRMAFNHQSGVCDVSGEVPEAGFNNWELMIGLVEDTTPLWEPGTRVGYHGMTIGWLIGELVRRVSGKS